MRCPALRAHAPCVGSGVVETGCTSAIGGRLERADMHCTVASAAEITALRCGKLPGRFEDFWERLAEWGNAA